jgi:mannose-6-phosphate isomerase-like protein (cupin superfamily)
MSIVPLTRNFGGAFVHKPESARWAQTTWGEAARVLVSPLIDGQAVCVMDYRAPANFGPPRHIHLRDDEVLRLVSGRIAVWSPDGCATAEPGDVVLLPKGVPHTWRSLDTEVHMEVTTAPGDFETFFQCLEAAGILRDNVEALTRVATEAGMTVVGPPLTSDEALEILRAQTLR